MQAALGIDVGTAWTRVAIWRDGRPGLAPHPLGDGPNVPTALALRSGEAVRVGLPALQEPEADRCTDLDPAAIDGATRLRVGSRSFRAPAVLGMFLRRIVEGLPVSPATVALAVPAALSGGVRRGIVEAASIAGLRAPTLIEQPVAATLAALGRLDADERILVVACGAGGTDVASLRWSDGVLEVEAREPGRGLGGRGMDAALLRWLEHAGAALDADAARRVERSRVELTQGEARFVDGAGRLFTLRPHEVDRALAPVVDEVGLRVHALLRRSTSGPPTRVLLAGDAARTPALRQRIGDRVGAAYVEQLPSGAAAVGACLRAAMAAGIAGRMQGVVLSDR